MSPLFLYQSKLELVVFDRSTPISETALDAFGSHSRWYETGKNECLRLRRERHAALSSLLLVHRGEIETEKLLLDTMPYVSLSYLAARLLMMLEMIKCIQLVSKSRLSSEIQTGAIQSQDDEMSSCSRKKHR